MLIASPVKERLTQIFLPAAQQLFQVSFKSLNTEYG